MKIVFLTNDLWYLKNFKSNLIETLNKKHHLKLLGLNSTMNDILFNCDAINLKSNFKNENKITILFTIIKAIIALSKIKPDLILSFNPFANLISIIYATFYRCKTILNISGFGRQSNFIFKIDDWFLNLIYRKFYNNAYLIFVQNTSTYKFFKKNFNLPNKIKILPGSGIDPTNFSILKKKLFLKNL